MSFERNLNNIVRNPDDNGSRSFTLDGYDYRRPEKGHILVIRFQGSGSVLKYLKGDVAVLKKGDELELHSFNRFVKRAFALDSKAPAVGKVDVNKSGMEGIRINDRFQPFNALRGYIEFKVISLVDDPSRQVRPRRGSIEII